jgi:hypothetical protein
MSPYSSKACPKLYPTLHPGFQNLLLAIEERRGRSKKPPSTFLLHEIAFSCIFCVHTLLSSAYGMLLLSGLFSILLFYEFKI